MRVAIAGPLWTAPLARYLDADYRSNLPPGTGAQMVTNLVAGFVERGTAIVVVTLDPSVSTEFVATGPNLKLCVGPFRRRGRARDAFKVERAYVSSTLRRERPDIVHAQWTYEYALGALNSALPTIVTVRDWAPQILRYQLSPYRMVRLLMQLQTLRRGTYFTTVSPYMQQRMNRWTRKKPVVVPNAVPQSMFDRTHRTLSSDAPVLLSVNIGFGRRKNVTTLLRAFSDLVGIYPASTLWLVGAGYEENGDAHRWARESGLDENVRFHGHLSQVSVAALMEEADVLVHPSLEESFGLVLVEAMAKGLPVVGGEASGAVPWVLDGGTAGVLTDVRSPTALAASIDGLLADPRRWAELSREGYARAWTAFRLPVALDGYWEQYEVAQST